MLNACKVIHLDMLSEFTARNPGALQDLIKKHGVHLRRFPDDVVQKLRAISQEVVAEIAQKDAFSKKVYESYQRFLQQPREYSDVSELAYLLPRDRT